MTASGAGGNRPRPKAKFDEPTYSRLVYSFRNRVPIAIASCSTALSIKTVRGLYIELRKRLLNPPLTAGTARTAVSSICLHANGGSSCEQGISRCWRAAPKTIVAPATGGLATAKRSVALSARATRPDDDLVGTEFGRVPLGRRTTGATGVAQIGITRA